MTRFSDFNDEGDGLYYAAVVALGFATYENIHYLPALEGFAQVGRAFSTPLTHVVFASVWGYWVGRQRVRGRRLWAAALLGVPLAALTHGLFNILTLTPSWRLLGALLLLVLWVWRIHRVELVLRGGGGRGRVN